MIVNGGGNVMRHQVQCIFCDVSEHDMDMLFLEEFACSAEFMAIFANAVGIENASVLSVESSKTDIALGESDMTVVVESEGEKIGFLIEDKIDAIAMPEQAARYVLRGQKGIDRGDYDRFYVFIVAPRKYLQQNVESQKYPNRIEYETILEYFEKCNDARSDFKIQQIKQAIEKQKKGYQVEEDTKVTEFWRRYAEYQQEHYPQLYFRYKGEVKGSKATWPLFGTVNGKLYIYHKTEFGFVDLTFENCADRIIDIEKMLADAIEDYLKQGFTVQRTSKSAAIRLFAPVLDFHKSFEEQQNEVDAGLEAVSRMAELVKMLDAAAITKVLNYGRQ